MYDDRDRRKWRRSICKVLCCMVLLYGDPLLAIQLNARPRPEIAQGWQRAQELWSTLEPSLRLPDLDLDSAGIGVLWAKLTRFRVEELGPGVGERKRSLSAPGGVVRIAALGGQALSAALASYLGWSHTTVAQGPPRLPAAPPAPPGFQQPKALPPTQLPDDSVGFFQSVLDEIPLLPGANLLSLPEQPNDPDPAVVLNAAAGAYTKVYAYDACDPLDPWKTYDPNDPAGSDLTALDHQIGFWIDVDQPAQLPSDGVLPATTTFPLCAGWNLIGFPSAKPRHVRNALASIEGKYLRVYGFDVADPKSPWEVFAVNVPEWATDLKFMKPGHGYWVLATEDTTLEIANLGPPPAVDLTAPADLSVVTAPTEVMGTVASNLLESWSLRFRPAGEDAPFVEIASGVTPVQNAGLGSFDPTLLLNGLYEIRLQATDVAGQQVEESIAVAVEGQMKIGNFTLSFLDLAVPLSGLTIEVTRTYDSRNKRRGDFGFGWTLDVGQGSYRNNRPPGDGWLFQTGLLPCDTIAEVKSHLTTIRLSDREIYRFALQLSQGADTAGGCFAQASFAYVDGPLPGTTLEILDGTEVFFANGSDRVVDPSTQETYVPQNVRLTTRDGRIFHLTLEVGVTHLEDLNGNALEITPSGITHSSGRGIEFVRDGEGRIEKIVDPLGHDNVYVYNDDGDLVTAIDREGASTRFTYGPNHLLEDVENALGVRAVRTEYDDEGRLIRTIDAGGKVVEFDHDIAARREVITNRLGQSRILEYDDRGNVVREVNELGKATLRSFDDNDNLLAESDPLGNTIHHTYDSANNLTSVRNALDNTTSYTHNSRGQVLTVTDPRGKVTTNVYDARGNPESITDPTGAVTSFTYDDAGNVLSQTDAEDGVTTFEYNPFGNPTKRIDALGNETSFTYDANGNQLTETTARTLPGGDTETLTTTFRHDRMGRRIATIYADGTSSNTRYDTLGRVVARIDALGRRTTFSYDPLGRKVATVYPDSTSDSRTYDAEGRLASFTDQGGRVTRYFYDAAGRLTKTIYPDSTSTEKTYDDAGRLVATTDARNHTTGYVHDGAGRVVRTIDPLGGKTDVAYDDAGNQTSVTDPNRQTTTFHYDSANRLVRVVFADGTDRLSTYDKIGREISKTDQAGRTTRFGFDALGRLVSVTDALDQVTRYAYDDLGNRISQTDANSHTTSFEFDSQGRRVKRILPDGSFETMAYDAVGNLIGKTDFAGRTISLIYDAGNRLVGKTLPGGVSVGFTYTATGRRATASDSRGTTSYAYDDRDRLIEVAFPDGRKLVYGYDANGNRTSLSAQVAGQVLTTIYSFDGLNRLVTVTDPEGGVYVYGYDANGNRTSLAYPNGIETTYAYDQLNRLTELTSIKVDVGSVVQSYAYTLGPAGNRIRIDELGGVSRAYGYDDLYRLTPETVSDVSGLVYEKEFVYDPVGNRLTQIHTDAGGTTTTNYGYDDRDRLLSEGDTSYSWGANGNLTGTAGEATYGWDIEDRLKTVTLTDGTVVTHAYDFDGVRVRTEVTPPGGPTQGTDYLVDTSGSLSQVVAETDGGGALVTYNVRGAALLSLIRGTERSYYHADGLGSIRALTDESGEVTDRWIFAAFGELLEHAGDNANLYLFAGEQFEPNTGFYYLRARWMDPAVGRFTGLDPFGGILRDPRSLHSYQYAANDPLLNVDPKGRFFTVAGALAVLAVSAIALVSCGPPNLSIAPPAMKVISETVVKDHSQGFYKDIWVEIKTDSPDRLLIVQWMRGFSTTNGMYRKVIQQGKETDSNFPHWIVDRRRGDGIAHYSGLGAGLFRTEGGFLFRDHPGLHAQLNPKFRYVFAYEFIVNIYDKRYTRDSISALRTPWDPPPLARLPWDFYDILEPTP